MALCHYVSLQFMVLSWCHETYCSIYSGYAAQIGFFPALPLIMLRCPLPPLAGRMPVSYLRDGDQAKTSTAVTLPITRALLVDFSTISMGFYGYLLYFKCMFA